MPMTSMSPPFGPDVYDTTGAFDKNLGREYTLTDTWFGTGLPVTFRLVRNTSGTSLLGARMVRFDTGTTYPPDTAVFSYQFQSDIRWAGAVHHTVVSTGVPDGARFLIVVDGPCLVANSYAAMGTDVAVGDVVTSVTAGSSGAATTAVGRFTNFTAGATTHTFSTEVNVIGRAMTARTTGNTNTNTLINIKRTI